MKTVDIKARIDAIRKLHTYGPSPLEEALLRLVEDVATSLNELAAELDEPAEEPAKVQAPGKSAAKSK